jgi:hypothetical protein
MKDDRMSETDFEAQLQTIASGMIYPHTPNIAAFVSTRIRSTTRPPLLSRTLAWSLTIVLILISSLMLIPPARAAILEFIQVGVVRIFHTEVTPVSPPNQGSPAQTIPLTATPAPPQALIPALRNVAGEVTLETAQVIKQYSLLLPTYPPGLGKPDYVFLQDADGPMLVLVWLDPQQPDRVLMSLHFLPAGSWAIKKMEPKVIQETSVNGQYAVWTTGPYPMRMENGDMQFIRMVSGHVLIWEGENVTYRLETDASMEQAIKIAESLAPIQ